MLSFCWISSFYEFIGTICIKSVIDLFDYIIGLSPMISWLDPRLGSFSFEFSGYILILPPKLDFIYLLLIFIININRILFHIF